mgnify:CR=1 FL=1
MSITFTSKKNYLKRDSATGSTVVSAPSSVAGYGGGFIKARTHTVSHGLGYIPQVRVYFENSDTDGRLYPAGGRRLGVDYVGLDPFGGGDLWCLYEVSDTTLTIYLECDSFFSPTGTRRLYWVIYKDSPL